MKRILFVGLGGAGQRHLRVLHELLRDDGVEMLAYRSSKRTPVLRPDFSVETGVSLLEKYGLREVGSVQEGLDSEPQLVVVSTPTSLHLEPAQAAAERGIDLIVEKPLSHDLVGFSALAQAVVGHASKFMVSFQRRFHPLVRETADLLKDGQIGSVKYVEVRVASFVPEWHGYEDFRGLYACRAELGGGVILTEIHEIDLCLLWFGLPKSVYCLGGARAGQGLDVEDCVHMLLDYGHLSVDVRLDFMNRMSERSIRISGTQGTAVLDLQSNRLCIYGADGVSSERSLSGDYDATDQFRLQARNFFERLEPGDMRYLEAAEATLLVAGAAKKSLEVGCKVLVEHHDAMEHIPHKGAWPV